MQNIINETVINRHKHGLTEKEYTDLNKVLARNSNLSVKEKEFLVWYAVKGIPMELRGRVYHIFTNFNWHIVVESMFWSTDDYWWWVVFWILWKFIEWGVHGLS